MATQFNYSVYKDDLKTLTDKISMIEKKIRSEGDTKKADELAVLSTKFEHIFDSAEMDTADKSKKPIGGVVADVASSAKDSWSHQANEKNKIGAAGSKETKASS